ncbi:hypothetical protein CHF27_011175 [Romboutsia maritimum]|uniref:Phage head morphogenesis domain-containing protein n=1 Tax=Romboutsia maritimum TaxID=2020948 RepID=A0A371IQY4_9FIRM|nr:hypothetical protein [Romboutsia maritimum]RDY22873.1 hypothetical protein CHF27_011175 [Romboutsia maritimum]
MAIDSFNKLMKDVENKRNKSMSSVSKKVRKLYKDIANDYLKELSRANKNSLRERYLEDSIKYLQQRYDAIGEKLEAEIASNIDIIIKETTDTQLSFFSSLCVDLKPHFTDMFTKIHEDVLRDVISGEMYKDKINLSKRIWKDIDKTKGDLEYVLSRGLAEKKGTYEIAKDLEKYVNPKVKKDYEWSKIYPKSKKTIDYNAYRLANTYINHAYQYAAKKSCSKNPYITGMKWLSGHGSRVCPICSDRDGQIYLPKDIPLDHANGRCSFTYVTEKDLEDIGAELRSWIDGEENEKLDNWFKKYGIEFLNNDKDVDKWEGEEYNESNTDVEKFIRKDFSKMGRYYKKCSDSLTRKWYKWNDENIPNLIDNYESMELQAKQAHRLRNIYRTHARELMKDQELRKKLDKEKPNISFEDLVDSKMKRKNKSREEAIEDILKTATKTNQEVNKSLGLE